MYGFHQKALQIFCAKIIVKHLFLCILCRLIAIAFLLHHDLFVLAVFRHRLTDNYFHERIC